MRKLKKLATIFDDVNVNITIPLSNEEIEKRHTEYINNSYEEFKKLYRHHLYTPVEINFFGKTHNLQLNNCYNPFCKWYGLPQQKYESIKSKPSRYKIGGSNKADDEKFICNIITDNSIIGEPIKHSNESISNWSLAEEIKRLVAINSTIPMEEDYTFHKEGCKNSDSNPFDDDKLFYKRGKSSSNSQKYQCKECKKITNVLPTQNESFTYHQGRSEILIQFAKDIVSRTPVKRTCEKLNIASGTYYSKLEWLYKKCLEFLEAHESKPLFNMNFNEIWLNTDMFIYNLNNIKQKGKGGKKAPRNNEKKLQTCIISSGDLKSSYIFRSDVAYDFSVKLEDIENDTKIYHCDHNYKFLRKNERLKYPYCPQLPTMLDFQTEAEYIQEFLEFNKRKNYVDGCHVKAQYTSAAHYWLIKQMINSSKWYFVSDDDTTLQSCIFRVFQIL